MFNELKEGLSSARGIPLAILLPAAMVFVVSQFGLSDEYWMKVLEIVTQDVYTLMSAVFMLVFMLLAALFSFDRVHSEYLTGRTLKTIRENNANYRGRDGERLNSLLEFVAGGFPGREGLYIASLVYDKCRVVDGKVIISGEERLERSGKLYKWSLILSVLSYLAAIYIYINVAIEGVGFSIPMFALLTLMMFTMFMISNGRKRTQGLLYILQNKGAIESRI